MRIEQRNKNRFFNAGFSTYENINEWTGFYMSGTSGIKS